MKTQLVTAPAVEPITYQEVVDHLRLPSFDEERDAASIAYIDTLIAAVRDDAEDYTARKFITQTWKCFLDDFPEDDYFELPLNPVSSVTHVKYTDVDATITTLTVTTHYLTDLLGTKARIVLPYNGTWPTATLAIVNPIEVQFVCGYGSEAEDVPERIRQAMLIQIGDLYLNRQGIVQGQPIQQIDTYKRLLGPYRIFWL